MDQVISAEDLAAVNRLLEWLSAARAAGGRAECEVLSGPDGWRVEVWLSPAADFSGLPSNFGGLLYRSTLAASIAELLALLPPPDGGPQLRDTFPPAPGLVPIEELIA